MAQSKSKTKSKTKGRIKPTRKTKKIPKRAAKKKTKRAARKKPTTSTSVPSRVSAGDKAPKFTLPDQNGAPVSLSDFAGKKVVLYFYPKDDTPGCTKESCSFRDNLSTLEATDAVVLGVSFDDANSHQKFISKYQLNFPLLSDSNRAVADAYGCYVEKNMYGNISKGIERSTFVIDRAGKIAVAFRKVSVDGHTQEVLDALSKIP